MKEDNKCNLCGKDRKGFSGEVWYSGNMNTRLCKGCYLKWCKSKECKQLEEKHKKAKPTTKAWYKKCSDLQKAFDKWYYAKGGTDE